MAEHIKAFKGLKPPESEGEGHGLMPDMGGDWETLGRVAAKALDYAELLMDADRTGFVVWAPTALQV